MCRPSGQAGRPGDRLVGTAPRHGDEQHEREHRATSPIDASAPSTLDSVLAHVTSPDRESPQKYSPNAVVVLDAVPRIHG